MDNDQFVSWPGLTSEAVRKYLPESIATVKGHMARPQQFIQSSTRPKKTKKRTTIEAVSSMQCSNDNEDMHPTETPNAECHLLHCQ